jgi:two-component system sensor histidine kinase RegB
VPLTIAAVTLPWRYSVILSGIALTLYTLLLAQFYPLETLPSPGKTCRSTACG